MNMWEWLDGLSWWEWPFVTICCIGFCSVAIHVTSVVLGFLGVATGLFPMEDESPSLKQKGREDPGVLNETPPDR